MMKLLIQTLYPAPYRVALFELLSKEHQITVFYEKDNDQRDPRYCQKSNQFQSFILGTKKTNRKYREAIRGLKTYDCVLFFEYSTPLSAKLIVRCILQKVNYAINCDGAVQNSARFPQKQVKSFFIRHAALCLAGGNRAKEYFLFYGAKESRIAIHRFTSVFQSEVNAPASAEEKRRMRLKNHIIGETLTVSVGRFVPGKRFDLLLDVWKTMPQTYTLYLIGGGKAERNLRQTVVDYGLKNVHILGFMERTELFQLYSMADIFVFPTETDVWGLVINEAMAKGLPVISTQKCTAAVEMVQNSVNGFLIEESDREQMILEFRQKILQIFQENKQEEFGKNSLFVAQKYTFEKMATVILAELRKLE